MPTKDMKNIGKDREKTTSSKVDSKRAQPVNGVTAEAIENEIRIAQSVQSQENLPALLSGLALCAVVVGYLDWQAAVSSYAVYPLCLIVLMLFLPLGSYLRLRKLPRPAAVSKRRIRNLEIYTALFGVAWGAVTYLVLSELSPFHSAFIVALIFSLCFAAAALNPGLPRASTAFCGVVLVALTLGLLKNDIVPLDLLIIFVGAVCFPLARTIWKNWRQVIDNVKLGLEKLQVEAETRRRETEAMRSMIEAIPFPLVLTRETGALEASKTAARQFGIPEGGAVGLAIRDFLVDPDDLEKMAELQTTQGRIEGYELQLKNARGEPFWSLLSSLPLRYEEEDCWLNAIYVIDDRKKAEADLIEAHTTLERVSNQLAKYISPQLYQAVFTGEQKVAITSKRKKLTVFFSDIVGFASLTEDLEAEQLTSLLNHYLSEMSVIAMEHGAYFDKFIGDAMMFYFGDPETNGVKEDASACVRMAIAMQRRLKQLRVAWHERGLIDQPLETRMGINTGYCTVGNFGSDDRMDYTIIGGEVNLASRLESNADSGGILISEETYSLVKDWVQAEQQEAIVMKGFSKPVSTYSVTGIYDDTADENQIIHYCQEDESAVKNLQPTNYR
jgi:PAS domain S-box-containing protein